MILDKFNLFSDNADAKAARYTGTSIDLTKAGDAGADSQASFFIQVTAAFTRAAGAIGSTFSLQTHTADDFTADRTVLWSSASIAKADLVAGYRVFAGKIPYGVLRYLNVVVVNANAADAANIDAGITPVVQKNDL